jgi:hypothetical protein
MVFSQPLNWDLTADVTGGPWKGTKIKRRPQKGVSVFQGHRRKPHLLEGLSENFPNNNQGSRGVHNPPSCRRLDQCAVARSDPLGNAC